MVTRLNPGGVAVMVWPTELVLPAHFDRSSATSTTSTTHPRRHIGTAAGYLAGFLRRDQLPGPDAALVSWHVHELRDHVRPATVWPVPLRLADSRQRPARPGPLRHRIDRR